MNDPFINALMKDKGFPTLQSLIDYLYGMKINVGQQYDISSNPNLALTKEQISAMLKDAEKFGAPTPKIIPDFEQTPYRPPNPNSAYLVEKVRLISAQIDKLQSEQKAKAQQTTDMWWHPKGKPKILASQMETPHLFFALRLLYNQAMPPKYRIDYEMNGTKTDVLMDQSTETKEKIRILFHIINQREDILFIHFDKLRIMADNVRKYL